MKMTEDENNVVEESVEDNNVAETNETDDEIVETNESANNVAEVNVNVPNMAEPTIVENIGLENQVVDDNINDDNESAEEMLENVYRILIVDDEKEVLHALRRTLLYAKQFKSEIKTVENAETALEEIEKRDIDLILCDYRMPGMTGTQFLQKVRDKYPDIVRIIVTGFSDIEIIKEAINKAEIHYYIEKPWINEQVRTIVYEALKRKAKRESDKIGHSKEKILSWLMDIYDDVKSMGIDLSFIEQNIQIAKEALDTNNLESALTYINHTVNILKRFAEISYPKLNVKVIDDIQIPADKWSKLNIEINNIGNSNGIDVQLNLKGDFEVKEIETIPTIDVGETIPLTVEILPKENGTFPMEVGISCKKPFDNTDYAYDEIFWIRVGDLVGKTKLKRKFGYHRGYIKMELNIINEDLKDIRDVDLELKYDGDQLTLSHIKPNYNILNNKFIIGDIPSHKGKYIEIYFDPLSCSKPVIGGRVSYKTLNNYQKHISLSPQTIRILCPILSTNDRIGLTELKNLLYHKLKYSGSKVLTIPLGLDIESLNKICKELIFKYDVKLIEEINSENPHRVETWFYAITKDEKNKFAIKIRIDEDTDSIELYIASSNNPAITGFLTDLVFKLSSELQERGITNQPLKQLTNIALKENFISAKRCLFYKELEKLEEDLNTDMAQQMKKRSKPLAQKFDNISRKEIIGMTKGRHETSKMPKKQNNNKNNQGLF